MPMVNFLEELFPGLLKGNYRFTSPKDTHYNCIAWAAGDTEKWWWPGPKVNEEYWPPGVTREVSLTVFREVFASLGYQVCQEEESELGFEKIALFGDSQGKPTHAARQLPNGRWASKLGRREDLEHALHDLAGTVYGSVVLIMRRPVALVEGKITEEKNC